MSPVRVLVVDDQVPFRTAAVAVAELVEGFEVVAEAGSAEEALALTDQVDPDVVIMDINLPGMSGIKAASKLSQRERPPFVVLVSTYAEGDLPPEARASGAAAYVHKEHFDADLLEALWHDRTTAGWRTA